MARKKAKSTTAARKPAKNKTEDVGKPNQADVRKQLTLLVETAAADMIKAVIEDGKKGQLSPVKYLLEVASIFPAPTDGSQSSTDEDSLAQTLLRRLDLPDEPVVIDDEDEKSVAAQKPSENSGEMSSERRDEKTE